LIVDHSDRERVSFLVAGDTGEGDASQYVVVPPMLSRARGTAFLFVCSDVIYPAGGIGSYQAKFSDPYEDYEEPIYAVPGNHDWYDDGTGFMSWFCGANSAPRRPRQRLFSGPWLRDLVRHRGQNPGTGAAQARQPAPYFAIDAGPLRLVGIDTGIRGRIDRDQATWLRRVSRESPKPKILLTGKPLYVDGDYHPGDIEGDKRQFVDDVVTNPAHNYIAAIGGDIHNYQRYPVHLKDGRTIVYLVSGGGGAFMHETHTILNLDTLKVPVTEEEFRCYPLRGDSLSRFSQLYARKLRWVVGPLWRRLYLAPEKAAAIMSERLCIPPTRGGHPVRVTGRDRFAARVIFRLRHRGQKGLHVPFAEWLDWNQPPMFKSFLRVDASPNEVRIRCFAATGCVCQEDDPPVEDEVRARRRVDGSWEWKMAPNLDEEAAVRS
jgi:hypothetical protein